MKTFLRIILLLVIIVLIPLVWRKKTAMNAPFIAQKNKCPLDLIGTLSFDESDTERIFLSNGRLNILHQQYQYSGDEVPYVIETFKLNDSVEFDDVNDIPIAGNYFSTFLDSIDMLKNSIDPNVITANQELSTAQLEWQLHKKIFASAQLNDSMYMYSETKNDTLIVNCFNIHQQKNICTLGKYSNFHPYVYIDFLLMNLDDDPAKEIFVLKHIPMRNTVADVDIYKIK